MYVIFEFMESDLHTIIRAEILREVQMSYIVWQLLCALKFLHSAKIVHRDLKPSNVLVSKDCRAKLADFGLARYIADVDKFEEPVLTDYISTRWYRAPEILLGS